MNACGPAPAATTPCPATAKSLQSAPMSTALTLLDLLADGRFHSGSELSSALGIARTTVWKHVQVLEEMGLDIYAVRGRGYRLAESIERLDAAAIRAYLKPTPSALPPAVHVLDQVDSTNYWLAQRAEHAPDGSACLAEQQLAGRGRRGRTWVSPFGRNMYLSLLWRLPMSGISGLSIAMGVTVADACESVGVAGLSLKWPNDLVAASGKVGGILVDVESSAAPDAGDTCTAIIGIGLNVDMPARLRQDITQPCADLNELAGQRISRNELAAALIEHGREALPRFAQEGLAPFQERFATRDASRDHPVTVEEGGRISTGHARGIDIEGALMLETAEGITRIHSGDVSLRALS